MVYTKSVKDMRRIMYTETTKTVWQQYYWCQYQPEEGQEHFEEPKAEEPRELWTRNHLLTCLVMLKVLCADIIPTKQKQQ